MAQRQAFVYETRHGWLLVNMLAKELHRVGIRLTHPTSGSVVLLDHEGEQILTSSEGLEEQLRKADEVSFQWWFAENHDVYCRVRRSGSFAVAELGMEGCSKSELASIREALMHHLESSGGACCGLVFDSEGVSEDCDWDGFYIRRETLDWQAVPFGFPDLVAMQNVDAPRMLNAPGVIFAETMGCYTVFRNSSLGSLGATIGKLRD